MITYSPMTRTQTIALIAGGIATFAVFVMAMWLLIFGGYFSEKELLVHVSIALGPVAVVSVMVGYAVWWLAIFFMSLLASESAPPDHRE
jgi:hypothetical protein